MATLATPNRAQGDQAGWDAAIKQDLVAINGEVQQLIAQVTSLIQQIANKADLVSPHFTGTPTSPTAASTDNSTTIATTAFVRALIAASGGGGTTPIADTISGGNASTVAANTYSGGSANTVFTDTISGGSA